MVRSGKPEKLTPAPSTAAYPRLRPLLAGLGAAVLATSIGACTSDGASTDARPIDAGFADHVYVLDGTPPVDAHPIDAEIDAPLPDAAPPATDASPGGKR